MLWENKRLSLISVFICLFLQIGSQITFAACTQKESVVQMIKKAKKEKSRYLVAIVTLLPGDKNVVKFLSRKEGKFVIAGEIESSDHVRRFSVDRFLLSVNFDPKNIPKYTNFGRSLTKKKKILLEGFSANKEGVQYLERDQSCGPRIYLKNGKVVGFITLDSQELRSMKKLSQTMTIEEFKDYFQNLDKKL